MRIKNIRKVTDTEYVCEIQHPEYGWIPYTALEGTGEPEMEEIWDKITSSNKSYKTEFPIIKERTRRDFLNQVGGWVEQLKVPYSKDEQSLWNTKRMEADKVVAGGKSELIEMEAALSGETPEEVAQKIVRKNHAYNIAVIKSEAMKKSINKDFDQAKTPSEVDALNKKYQEIIKKTVVTT